MRTWTREPLGTMCGRCDAVIRKGDPKLVISGASGWAKDRCQDCAEEAVPELPALPERPIAADAPKRVEPSDWRGMRIMAEDYKLKQAGDR